MTLSGAIREEVSHQLKGEPEMRFVSTVLVMTTIALMLLALMLLGPVAAKSVGANESPSNNSQTMGIEHDCDNPLRLAEEIDAALDKYGLGNNRRVFIYAGAQLAMQR